MIKGGKVLNAATLSQLYQKRQELFEWENADVDRHVLIIAPGPRKDYAKHNVWREYDQCVVQGLDVRVLYPSGEVEEPRLLL